MSKAPPPPPPSTTPSIAVAASRVLAVQLPPGPLGATFAESADDGACVVSSVTSNANSQQLRVGDVIVSLNGIKLAEVEGGAASWTQMFEVCSMADRALIVQRLDGAGDSGNEMGSTDGASSTAAAVGTTAACQQPMTGLENVPSDHEGAPMMPAARTDALDETDEEAKAAEIDEAIQAILNDASDAPMTSAEIAAYFEEAGDAKKCVKGRPEVIEDEDSPMPESGGTAEIDAANAGKAVAPKVSGYATAGGRGNAENNQQPHDAAEDEGQSPFDPENAGASLQPPEQIQQNSTNQGAPAVLRPPPISQQQTTEQIAGVPVIEARLVEDETIIDAVPIDIRANEHEENNDQPTPSWWRQHQRLIILVMFLFIAALIAILGAFLLSSSGGEGIGSETSPAAIAGSPTPRPSVSTAPPTVSPSARRETTPTGPSLSPVSATTESPSPLATIVMTPKPTRIPTSNPTTKSPVMPKPTQIPTSNPTKLETNAPTKGPPLVPSASPSVKPTPQPTQRPTTWPTKRPTSNPTRIPTSFPTSKPVSSAATQISQSTAVKLVPSEAIASHSSAKNVAIHGDTAVVGAPNNDDEKGAVFVFVKGANGEWLQQSKLVAPDGANGDDFGYSAGIFGDTIVVGARYGDDDNGWDSGSAHVFVQNGADWSHQAKLLAPDGAAWDHFGASVAIYQDTIVVGAYGDEDNGVGSGSAHMFVRSGANWSHQAKLLAPDGAANDFFGNSVAIYQGTIVVGAMWDDDNGVDSGSAHVFVRNGDAWTHQAKILAPDGAADDAFGMNVAIYEGTIVVGAEVDDDNGSSSGSVHVFVQNVQNGATWTHQAKLLAPDGDDFDYFGTSVAIHGNLIVVGARGDDDNGEDSGSAHVFVREGANWNHQTKLVAPDAAADDQFGKSVAIDNGTALVGSMTSAYVFSG